MTPTRSGQFGKGSHHEGQHRDYASDVRLMHAARWVRHCLQHLGWSGLIYLVRQDCGWEEKEASGVWKLDSKMVRLTKEEVLMTDMKTLEIRADVPCKRKAERRKRVPVQIVLVHIWICLKGEVDLDVSSIGDKVAKRVTHLYSFLHVETSLHWYSAGPRGP
jgi:hypothetical protein